MQECVAKESNGNTKHVAAPGASSSVISKTAASQSTDASKSRLSGGASKGVSGSASAAPSVGAVSKTTVDASKPVLKAKKRQVQLSITQAALSCATVWGKKPDIAD